MRQFQKFATAVVLAVAMCAGAAFPASSQGYNWGGIYVGVHGGGAWADVDWALAYPYGSPPPSSSFKQDRFIWGGHVGIQHQIGNFVVGAELSTSRGFGSKSINGVDLWSGLRVGDLRTDIDQLVTATGRLGYAMDRWMVYIKAGYAGAKIGLNTDDNVPGDFISGVKTRHAGFTIGTGVEYALTNNLILGLEYSYVDLGKDIGAAVTTLDGTPLGPNINANSDVDTSIHAITARLSFKLGREPAAAAAPLK